MRGKSTSPTRSRRCGRNALVRRHARRTPKSLARCVLTPLSAGDGNCVRTSLYPSYSVFGEKKVSRTNLKYFSEAVVSERLSFGSSRVNCFVLARIDFEARYAAH